MLKSFKDFERMMTELEAIMLKYLYVSIVVYNSSRFFNFLEFLDMCSSFP
jgi:hypothetical protein